MENQKICQSCAMPLDEESFATNADGSRNEDYCIHCYKDGAFTSDTTMEEMIEICVPFMKDHVGGEEQARAMMTQMFPQLKRWAVQS